MTLVLVVATFAVLGIAAYWLLNRHALRGGLDDVDRFAAARGVTTRWADDPSSAPAPVRRITEELAGAREEGTGRDTPAA